MTARWGGGRSLTPRSCQTCFDVVLAQGEASTRVNPNAFTYSHSIHIFRIARRDIFICWWTFALLVGRHCKILGSSCWSEDCFPPLHPDWAALLRFAETPRGVSQHSSFQRLPSATSASLQTDLSDLPSLYWFWCPQNQGSVMLVQGYTADRLDFDAGWSSTPPGVLPENHPCSTGACGWVPTPPPRLVFFSLKWIHVQYSHWIAYCSNSNNNKTFVLFPPFRKQLL